MTVIDESLSAKGFTPAAQVPATFGAPRTIEGIVIHHWGLTGQTHDGVCNFFVTGPGQTSAHYVASAGRINCLVAPEDAAWHCPGKNASTIGIECRPEATDADYATVAELIRTLRAQYGNLPLSRHRDWYNTACPGVWDLDRLNQLAGQASIATEGTISPQGTITQEEDDMFTDQDRADLKLALDDAHRSRGVLDAIENDRIRERIVAIDDRTAVSVSKYLKGDQEPTLYSFEDGKLRGITMTEWQATGLGYRTLPQDIINALPRA